MSYVLETTANLLENGVVELKLYTFGRRPHLQTHNSQQKWVEQVSACSVLLSMETTADRGLSV